MLQAIFPGVVCRLLQPTTHNIHFVGVINVPGVGLSSGYIF
jgi:hypothetical protein